MQPPGKVEGWGGGEGGGGGGEKVYVFGPGQVIN